MQRGRRFPGPRAVATAVAAVALLGAACGGIAPRDAAPVASPGPAAAPEDAVPTPWAEDEVDRLARPLAPIEPAYPPQLRALGVEGDVEARVVVRADGSVGGARLLSSSDEAFTAAVRDALAQARFQPAERAGRAVASWVTLRLRFRMEE